MKKLSLVLLLLVVSGCAYGPAHLNAFYSERNRYQGLIDQIERQYSLPSRDVDKGQALRETVDQLQRENERLRGQLQVLEDQWFKSLSPDQQLKWRLQGNQAKPGAPVSPRAPVNPSTPSNPSAPEASSTWSH